MEKLLNLDFKEKQKVCDSHGEYSSKNYIKDIWTPCPACYEDKQKKEDEKYWLKMREETLESWKRKIGNAGIPLRFQEKKFSNFTAASKEEELALEFGKHFAKNFIESRATGQSLIFHGKPGTGKTHLSCAIGMHVMHFHKLNVMFCTTYDAISSIKETWSKNSELNERQALERLVYPDLLILDEVGVQFGSESENLILFNILNKRYELRKPCILITNLDLDDLKKYLGDRLWDRFKEDNGEVVGFRWESKRGK